MNIETIDRPTSIRIATAFLWIAIAIQFILSSVVGTAFLSLISLLVSLGIAGLSAYIVYKIFMGKNWARITYAIVFVLIPILNNGSVTKFIELVKAVPILGVGKIIIILLEIVAIVLLFTFSSNNWFRKQKREIGISDKNITTNSVINPDDD